MMSQSWVGRTIANRYQLDALLGAGGMSAVYRAYDPNLRRVVAVKLIHPHLSENPNFVNRFKEEAAAVAGLRHPNIVQVHDFNNEGETYYMVMEYLAGETLQAHLRRIHAAGRQMPLVETLRVSLQVCEAAGYAHRHELVHRDIKPANIMLDVHGQAILMDFGIVKIVGGQYHTATGATIGTAIYMSPEQIRGEKVDERSDIYSLGVMMFEMLSGRPPYEADSALTLMMMHLNDPIPNPRDLRPDVLPELAAVVTRALAKERGQRYQTAAELAADLRGVEASLSAQPVEPETVADTRPAQAAAAGAIAEVEAAQQAAGTTQAAHTADAGTASAEEAQAAEAIAAETVTDAGPQAAEPAPAESETLLMEEPTQAEPLPQSETLLLEEAAQAQTFPEGETVLVDESPTPAEQAARGQEAAGGRAAGRKARWPWIVVGAVLVIALALGGFWLINQRRPPELELMPIARPTIPITLDTQAGIANLGQWDLGAYCQQLAFSPDTDVLATGCENDEKRYSPYRNYASLYRVAPGELQAHLADLGASLVSLDFSPDGSLLATSYDTETLELWQVQDGALRSTIESEEGSVAGLDWADNSVFLAGALWNGVGLWQVETGVLVRIYPSDEINLRSVAFSPDGELIAGGGNDGEIFLWRVGDGDLLSVLEGHSAKVYQLAFSPDGGQLASASEDHTLKVWAVETGELLHTLEGHEESVTGVTYSPDGSLLISSSWDGSLRLWGAEDGEPLKVIQTDEGLLAVGISADGAWLAAADSGGRVRFWGVIEELSFSMH